VTKQEVDETFSYPRDFTLGENQLLYGCNSPTS